MKRIVRLILVFFILSLFVSDCGLLDNCGTCSLVTEVDGIETGRTPGVLYCDENLDEKRNESPTTIGNRTTYWDCE
jgi:hypothetical protein